jgi:hypothetical protein
VGEVFKFIIPKSLIDWGTAGLRLICALFVRGFVVKIRGNALSLLASGLNLGI